MTSPRVIELPRRLEPVVRDTFLDAVEPDAPRAVSHLHNVVALRAADAIALRRRVHPAPPTTA
ncbi:MAG TPA: hypothetical protein VNA28_15060 [Solirubrobacteraceae bacterium]|nr:hypothetical protein [Solirubrobacteraceae bacterium]